MQHRIAHNFKAAIKEEQWNGRSIVCEQLAGGLLSLFFVSMLTIALHWRLNIWQNTAQGFQANPTRPQYPRHFRTEIKHCRLYPDLAGAAIQNQWHTSIQVSQRVLGGCRADMHETIGTRRGDRRTGSTNKRERNRMLWHANRNRIQSRGHQSWHLSPTRQDHGKRPRPERLGQPP